MLEVEEEVEVEEVEERWRSGGHLTFCSWYCVTKAWYCVSTSWAIAVPTKRLDT